MNAGSTPARVRAAGAVLWRRDDAGTVEVAVVHRPHYGDWSLPKGKLDAGETTPVAAAREVAEETGFDAVLGRFLTRVEYEVRTRGGQAPKTVDYFGAEAVGGHFVPNHEVDRLRWLSPAAAESVLDYPADRGVLREFLALPARLTTLLLVRHAKAGKRDEWNGDDDLRPLSDAGLRQAEAVRELVRPFRPGPVFAAPRLRCVQTVHGVAEELGTDVQHEQLLSEEGYWPEPETGIARLLGIVAEGGTPLVCSQGGVIPDVVARLAERDGVPLPSTKNGTVASKKGSVWLLSFHPGSGWEGRQPEQPPTLAAADYFASPLPDPVTTTH
ncbi:NUDIX hydrolase [Amycolatopsis cihanbeyliensis]|uniref:8-oxo-dGTP diphosphatase n=1 Tax=Amycolatopsis cihanbeyliensis TaxID=1128664 RepID=A0A542DH84_AMYCI|nr:NUDIX hydrolase [Amycolatopsis cihanbeyliensis]TQJ02396.1 8-oxo-dGTP diphosphatase [Amycolatopsis cihanbeyliensis]